MRPFNQSEICFVCRRRSWGIGVGDLGRKTGWTCRACNPDIAWSAFRMSDDRFDVYETKALKAAGGEAGAYLDSIGVTDLAKLTEGEWERFLRIVIDSFGDGIRKEIDGNQPPF